MKVYPYWQPRGVVVQDGRILTSFSGLYTIKGGRSGRRLIPDGDVVVLVEVESPCSLIITGLEKVCVNSQLGVMRVAPKPPSPSNSIWIWQASTLQYYSSWGGEVMTLPVLPSLTKVRHSPVFNDAVLDEPAGGRVISLRLSAD